MSGAQQALVSTLAYRLVSFWLPLPVGAVAQLLFRRRYGAEPESESDVELGESSTSKTGP